MWSTAKCLVEEALITSILFCSHLRAVCHWSPIVQSQVGCQSSTWSPDVGPRLFLLSITSHQHTLFENGIPFFESWAWGLVSSPCGQVIPLLAYTVKPMAGTQETLMGQMCCSRDNVIRLSILYLASKSSESSCNPVIKLEACTAKPCTSHGHWEQAHLATALSVLPLHLLKQGPLQDLWLHQLAKLTGQGSLWSYAHLYSPCHPWDYWYTPPYSTFTWVWGTQIQDLMLVWQGAQLLNFIILYGHASTFLHVRELLEAPQFKSRPKAALQPLPFSQLFGHGDTKAIDIARFCSKASVSWIHTLSFSNSMALDDLLNSLDINYHIHKVEKCLSPSYKMTCVKYLQGTCGGASAHFRQVATLIPVNGLDGIFFSASPYFQLQQIFWCHKKTRWILSTAYALCVH